MANVTKAVPENVPGEFFVDLTCIDCDTCRQVAPATFGETGAYAFVHTQPRAPETTHRALQALVCCPTGSIGTRHANEARSVLTDFPLPVEGEVFYCGLNSPKSYGGNSYFVRHPAGNWLIDSPKFQPRLVKRLEDLGGLAHVFLTHRDDVADAERFARHFGAGRVIHRLELASQPDAEIVLDGFEPLPLGSDFLAIPTPGHTRGHVVLLYKDRFLFTGDHLWWDRDDNHLGASRDYCWYSWEDQVRSMASLARFDFEWVLPGHGQRVRLPRDQMRAEMKALVERMRSAG